MIDAATTRRAKNEGEGTAIILAENSRHRLPVLRRSARGVTFGENSLPSESSLEVGTTPITAENRPRPHDVADVMQALAERERRVRALRCAQSDLHFDGGHLILGENEYSLQERGLRRLCESLPAPADYLLRLDPPMRNDLLQYHLNREDHRTKADRQGRLTLFVSEGEFLGFGRSDLTVIGASDVLQTILEVVGQDGAMLEVHDLEVSTESVRMNLVSPTMAQEVAVDDVIRGGFRIFHSFIGAEATQIEAYVLRLKCLNGLVHRECLTRCSITRTRRLPADHPEARQRQIEQVRRLTADTWTRMRAQLDGIAAMTDEEVDVEDFLAQFLRRARLHSKATMDLLTEAWQREGQARNAFAALNALTYVATHSSRLSSRHRLMLSRLAGVLAHRRTHICPTCFSVISSGR